MTTTVPPGSTVCPTTWSVKSITPAKFVSATNFVSVMLSPVAVSGTSTSNENVKSAKLDTFP